MPSAHTTYLITGGSGFVGSHLTDALLARGDSVTVLDDMSTGRRENLAQHAGDPRLRLVQGSVLDPLLVDELVHQCDVVVHLAAAVGVKLIVERPLRSLTTNIRGTETVIEAAHRHRRKVLLTSTSEIYGKNSAGPLSETSDRVLGNPGVVRWSYSTAKAVDEILANAYHRERGLPVVVVRLFNTVGPRQSGAYGMVIPRLVRQAVAGVPLTVFGDGTQTRCFTHVLDVVRALVELLHHDGAVGRTFNIGRSDEVSILELAKLIVELSGSTSGVDLVPYSDAYGAGFEDMARRVPDTTRLRELTGWTPRRTLDDILLETITEARAEQAAARR
ncbi:NAD-dependent epimerase/dehydratase family protein [Microbispora cellulosiformans]|uniref:NAD-dependent epimerase/dehydratase family protein n=1 Tax=Microbispora cellulosiformans TaxID=2614688 RepID=A0A5J5K3S6_9ACTN|nr:NAD-dependent epimerase/dehydratase family protein [Microbispora cellulosiformans]KAA9377514.1 NAD-dependent epimerase/dehydratase family protein [Microbispora cellulosiformans]